MIGFGRVVTDYVTFGYLTDVYILHQYQGKGLGRWMIECLNEVLDEWPHLRRFLLFTNSPQAGRLYEQILGVKDWRETPSSALSLLERRGKGVKPEPK